MPYARAEGPIACVSGRSREARDDDAGSLRPRSHREACRQTTCRRTRNRSRSPPAQARRRPRQRRTARRGTKRPLMGTRMALRAVRFNRPTVVRGRASRSAGTRLALRFHMPFVRSPTSATRSRIVWIVNASGSTSATSSQRSGAEARASGVGRIEYAEAIVRSREFWPKSTNTPRRSATFHVVVATSWSSMRRSTSCASALAKRRTSGKRSSRLIGDEDVEPGRARGLGEAREPELLEHLVHDEGDRAHVLPRVPLARVEVDQHVVRPLDVVHARVPRVQLDAAEVRDEGEPGRVGDHGEVGRAPAPGEDDVHRLEPVRMGNRNALLVEELALDAVRIALHLHRAALDVVQRARGEIDVVGDEVSLRHADLREVDLVLVRQLDVAASDPHGRAYRAIPHRRVCAIRYALHDPGCRLPSYIPPARRRPTRQYAAPHGSREAGFVTEGAG